METRNPYLDAQQAKGEAIKALKMLQRNNESVEQVSRKQIYLVNYSSMFSQMKVRIQISTMI